MSPRPRLLLVDDHALMAEGLSAMLEPDFEVIGVVDDGTDVLAAVERHRPDVVLLDLSLPGKGGLEVTAELRKLHPEVRVLIVTMHADRIYADEALRAGASGYVLKLARTEELKGAINDALQGKVYVTPLLTGPGPDPDEQLRPRGLTDSAGIDALTARQLEVLRLMAQGKTTQAIADKLKVTRRAVEFHRARIKRVLGLKSTAALVRFAAARGLV
jgi:DNA-binding NarL/FixJ family response regulator